MNENIIFLLFQGHAITAFILIKNPIGFFPSHDQKG